MKIKQLTLLAVLTLLTTLVYGDEVFRADQTFGKAMPGDVTTVGLSEAIQSLGSEEQQVKIRGRVTEVCQAKGCWMILVDDQDSSKFARITFEDYGFFMPIATSMQRSVVYGTLSSAVLSKDQARHFAEDAGQDTSSITEDVAEYSIVASAVQLENKG